MHIRPCRDNIKNEGGTNPGRQMTRSTVFSKVEASIGGSSVWKCPIGGGGGKGGELDDYPSYYRQIAPAVTRSEQFQRVTCILPKVFKTRVSSRCPLETLSTQVSVRQNQREDSRKQTAVKTLKIYSSCDPNPIECHFLRLYEF